MTIAEQLIRAKEDLDAVYQKGYDAGLRTLQGCFALKAWVSDFGVRGTYTLPIGVFTRFNYTHNGSYCWFTESINKIEVDEWSVTFYTADNRCKYVGFEDGWYGEDDQDFNNTEYMYIDIPEPVQVSQDVYNILQNLIDVEEFNAFTLGYSDGYSAGQTEGLEALGELCEWSVMVNSDSDPAVDIVNYHPSYYLHCTVTESLGNNLYATADLVIPPNSLRSYASRSSDSSATYGDLWFSVDNVRWKASAT